MPVFSKEFQNIKGNTYGAVLADENVDVILLFFSYPKKLILCITEITRFNTPKVNSFLFKDTSKKALL